MQRRLTLPRLLSLLPLVLGLHLAKADTLSFTGNLRTDAATGTCVGCTTDGDFAQFAAVIRSFTLGAASSVTATTFSYGGGVNGAGTAIAQSGFEPYLSLFDAAGNLLASTYSGTTCPAGAKTNTLLGGCYDVGLGSGTLAAGTYQIAISAFENLSYAENLGAPYTLSDGFSGLGNLYPGEDLHYAFDVNYTARATPPPPTSPVPEPPSAVLLGLGVSALLGTREQFKTGIFRRKS